MECVEDNRVVGCVGILFVEQDVLHAGFEDGIDMLLLKYGLTVDNHVVALYRHYLAGVLINEVLNPCAQHARRKLAPYGFLKVGLVDLDFLGKSEYLDDILIAFQTDGSQQRRHGQFLLTVNVSVHHIVDVSGKFYP